MGDVKASTAKTIRRILLEADGLNSCNSSVCSDFVTPDCAEQHENESDPVKQFRRERVDACVK